MKVVLLSAVVVSLFGTDEITRIEKIVKDVGELRQKYEQCQERLDTIETAPQQCAVNEAELKARHQEILKLKSQENRYQRKLDTCKKSLGNENAYLIKISALQKRYETLQKEHQKLSMISQKQQQETKCEPLHVRQQETSQALSALEAQHKRLQQRYAALEAKYRKTQEKLTQLQSQPRVGAVAHQAVNNDVSAFPKVVMKPGFEHLQEPKPVSAQNRSLWSDAGTYRLKEDATIYDAPNGKAVARWEAQTSFTSMQQEKEWIRITGYFVNKQWRPSREESLWVKREDALKR